MLTKLIFWKNPIRLLPKKGKTYARVVAKSRNAHSKVEITTLELCYPLVIHHHLLTHRVFSRNSESLRAIPTLQVIKNAWENFYVSNEWRERTKGMSPNAMQSNWKIRANILAHYLEFYFLTMSAYICSKYFDLAKEQVNRKFMPYIYIKTVLTSTEWDDFFNQRISPDAQLEVFELAVAIKSAMEATEADILPVGFYHLPYCTATEKNAAHAQGGWHLQAAIESSVSRCGRVSTANHGKIYDREAEKNFYNRSINANPPHWSVFEHVAKCVRPEDYIPSNLKGGWNQLRKVLP